MPVNIIINSEVDRVHLSQELLKYRGSHVLNRFNLGNKIVTVVFVDDMEMTRYNEQYRQRPGPTNVLAFPVEKPIQPHLQIPLEVELGDVIISLDTARKEALQEKKTLHDRLTELIIHGFLHLIGYDHERSQTEALAMWEKERELFAEIKSKRSRTMTKLAINVDHVATVRQARGGTEPDPVTAAAICELAGAQGIVVHLREDRRHIQERDVRLLRETVKTKLNLEMAAVNEIVQIALEIKPDMITLVPEKRQELTTEGGLNVIKNEKKMKKIIEKMNKGGIPVSLFIDPDAEQIEAAADVGATFVELHTGRYCDATDEKQQDQEFRLIESSAELAFESGLLVNAGHGLDYLTTARISALKTIEELSIGHAIISRAVFVGIDQAVREMLALMHRRL